ncbi:hypothetical protein [Actinomycetospora sp. CA-053990]|uniref:hypothetical protein n=1 Tax=Actinomycetospora sp. CA-053990 TaxID=3239891 RepID=UPI003D9394DB
MYAREINPGYGARSGSYFAYTRRPTAGRLNIFPLDFVPVTAGLQYAASIWVNRDGTGVITLDIDWYTGNGTGYFDTDSATLNPSPATWGRVEVVATAPPGATYGRMFLHPNSMLANNFIRFDAALFEQASSAGTYFDGDSAGFEWEGTAGDSTSIEVLTRSDSASLSESVTLIRSSAASDEGSLGESMTIARSTATSDSFTLSETTVATATGGRADSGALSESAAMTVAAAGTDGATLGESATLTVFATGQDNFGAGDGVELVGDETNLEHTDSFVLSDSGEVTTFEGLTAEEHIAFADSAQLTVSPMGFTDEAALTEVRELTRSSSRTDAGAMGESATLRRTSAASDSASLAESAALTEVRTLAGADTASLGESAVLITGDGYSIVDPAQLSEQGRITAVAAAADGASLSEFAVLLASWASSDVVVLTETFVVSVAAAMGDGASFTESAVLTVNDGPDPDPGGLPTSLFFAVL